MIATAPPLHFVPRRSHARLRLNMPARIMTLNGPREVTLLDLSQSGARFHMAGRDRITGGVLMWMGFEAFGVRVWQSGQTIGIRFERPINSHWVIATRNWKPSNREAKIESRDFARKWAKGAGEKPCELQTAGVTSKAKAVDLQYLRRSGKKRGQMSGGTFLLYASIIGVAAGIASCFF